MITLTSTPIQGERLDFASLYPPPDTARVLERTATAEPGYACELPGGAMHRDDGGPALVYYGSLAEWWVHGRRHRLEGPALVFADGTTCWFVAGTQLAPIHGRAADRVLADYGPEVTAQVLAAWRPDGPPLLDLAEAIAYAHLH